MILIANKMCNSEFSRTVDGGRSGLGGRRTDRLALRFVVEEFMLVCVDWMFFVDGVDDGSGGCCGHVGAGFSRPSAI